ncbi:hypothetical protein NFI96_030003, partial [Prochilodus magdalenae]
MCGWVPASHLRPEYMVLGEWRVDVLPELGSGERDSGGGLQWRRKNRRRCSLNHEFSSVCAAAVLSSVGTLSLCGTRHFHLHWVEVNTKHASTANVWVGLRHTCAHEYLVLGEWTRLICTRNWLRVTGTGVEDCSGGERTEQCSL